MRKLTLNRLKRKFLGKYVLWKNTLGDVRVFKVKKVECADGERDYHQGWLFTKQYDKDTQWLSGYASEYATIITKEEAIAFQL